MGALVLIGFTTVIGALLGSTLIGLAVGLGIVLFLTLAVDYNNS